MSSSSKTEEEKKEEEVRLLKVGGWEWKSDAIEEGKCRKGREWDWEKVVKRLVASPAGIVFLGDSITAQAYDSLALLLGNQGPIIERVLSPASRRLDAYRALYLDPSHPLTLSLLSSLPNLPRSRLSHPIARTIRSDYLIVESDRVKLGVEKVGRTRVKGTEWDLELRDAVRDVLGELKRGEEEFEWKESIVMTSVGNWWERWIDQIGATTGLQTFRQVAQLSSARLARLHTEANYTIFYRLVNRGASHCSRFDSPISLLNDTARDQEDHQWYLKLAMNDIFRGALSAYTSLTTTTRGGGGIQVLDVVDQAYQRPDAHRYPKGDCLHWCLPSVLDEWNKTWWALLDGDDEEQKVVGSVVGNGSASEGKTEES